MFTYEIHLFDWICVVITLIVKFMLEISVIVLLNKKYKMHLSIIVHREIIGLSKLFTKSMN